MTHCPAYTDIKVHIRTEFRQYTTGMGRSQMTKTLTPWHYLELQDNPIRTKLCLRAWCVMRAERSDGAYHNETRRRELDRLRLALEADIRVAHGAPLSSPLLHNLGVHSWLVLWVPQTVARLLGRP